MSQETINDTVDRMTQDELRACAAFCVSLPKLLDGLTGRAQNELLDDIFGHLDRTPCTALVPDALAVEVMAETPTLVPARNRHLGGRKALR